MRDHFTEVIRLQEETVMMPCCWPDGSLFWPKLCVPCMPLSLAGGKHLTMEEFAVISRLLLIE